MNLSIITPVLNNKYYIELCIKNIIDQNSLHIEHIIIDGGSQDGTAEIVKDYADKYSHIRWVSEKDFGQSHAMNKGIKMARNPIIGFLNADDYYEPNILNKVINYFSDKELPTVLVGNCNVWDDDGSLLYINKPFDIRLKNLYLKRFDVSFPINSSSYFYHKNLHDKIGLYDTNEHYCMDVDFILRAIQFANFLYYDESWGNYRYIRGTKTYEDDGSGGNSKRLEILLASSLNKQPFFFRGKIKVEYLFYKIRNNIFSHIKNIISYKF